MESQQLSDQAQADDEAARKARAVMLPQAMADHLKQSDITLFIFRDENGAAAVKPVTLLGQFDIENNAAHLLAAVIMAELPNLQASANGDWTDADRYQALRQFALLGANDKDRFEAVNRALKEYEESNGINLAAANEPETYDAYANFLCDVLLVTHPDDVAEQPKELVIPGSRIILPMR